MGPLRIACAVVPTPRRRERCTRRGHQSAVGYVLGDEKILTLPRRVTGPLLGADLNDGTPAHPLGVFTSQGVSPGALSSHLRQGEKAWHLPRALLCTTMNFMSSLMDSQLTVRLPAKLRRALDQASKTMRRKNGEIVRIALRQFLGVMPEITAKPIERVRGLIGSLESGIPDLAEQQRAYIIESLKDGR